MIRRLLPLLAAAALAQHARASADAVVVFNELQYNPAGLSEAGEYVELFNQQGIKVDISGWRIDGLGYTFPAGTIMNPGTYLVVAKTPTAGQFGPFTGSMGNDGQRLRLINQSDRMMDEISYGDDSPWPPGADGAGFTLAKKLPYTDSGRHANWTVSKQANGTPGTVNFPDSGPPPVSTVNLFNLNNTWRYNQSGPAYAAGWAATAHAVGGTGVNTWGSGPGALAYETPIASTVPIGTTLKFPGLNSPYVITYYFETEFNVTPQQLGSLSTLKLKHALDDGAVIYLNGVEATRVNMPAGTILPTTLATANVEAGTALSAYVPLPTTSLVAGSNRLSVEVHQFASGNSDIVWGAQLDVDLFDPVPGAAPPLRLSEIPASGEPVWWAEIVNTGAAAVDLTGTVLSVAGDAAREYVIPSGTLAGGGFLVLDQSTLGFRPLEGEKVFLFSTGKTALMDARQQTGRLRGRADSRSGEWAYPSAATPGAANAFVFNDSVVISEIQYNPPAIAPVPAIPATFQNDPLLTYGDTWRYNAADENLPANWATTAHTVGGNWKSGAGPIGVESAALAVPLVTVLTPYVPATVTYYFEKEFNVTAQQLANATSLEITHQIDDGAIFYLNGVELAPRFNMPGGAVNPETIATPSVGDAAINSVVISTTGLVVGTNRLSVEVHQSGTGSSDIVFGLKMDARVQLTPGTPAQPLTNSNNQWLELTNRSAAPVNLTGWDFEDGIQFAFAPNTILDPGERACLVRDNALFTAAFPAARVLGIFSGSMSRSGEEIVLRDALRNTVDAVRYFDSGAWPEAGDGGGSSIELRDLDADNNTGGAWAASDESSRTAWKTYTYSGTAVASNGPDDQWQEFNMGMLSAGELWIDDLSVIENPAGAATQKITDPGFNNAAAWRRRGNHRASQLMAEPGNAGNNILRLVATGPTEHMHNQIETTLTSAIANGTPYQISFRARWVTGGNQLHTRCYFNRLAKVNVIDRPANPGTPGAVNSRNITNAGPTFTALNHSPAVPAVSAVATVSCIATDPDGIGAMTLFYSVNGGAFASTSMSTTGGGKYTGSIPGQAAGAVVQFYIRGTDTLGAIQFYPALGPDSRALYKVNDSVAATNGWHNFRVITTNADRDWMHTSINVMSNDRFECTVIDREGDIYYNAAVRLKSSERGRDNTSRVGYNIDFPSDGLYRGVLGGVAVDRSQGQAPGQLELLFDMMISNSGGPISRYYDFVKVLSPNSLLNGGATLQMAIYSDTFLDEQFENGADGTLYEYEYIYYPTNTDTGTPTGNKLPQPDGIHGVGITNLGDDAERYRMHFLNKINREADNFAPIMNYCKLFSTSGAEFETLLPQRMDLDIWLRGMAYAVLSGAGDNHAAGDGHNGIFYARPDGRVIFLPHDMDFAFDSARSITANGQCAALTANPARRRQYFGHLQDVISTTYNNSYMSIWTSHFASLDPSQDWAGNLAYVTTRSNNVLAQITSTIPQVAFGITTASPLVVASSTATLNGNGWVDVREIRVLGSTEPLAVTWTGNSTWQATVPAPPGANAVTLQAVNFSGAVIGTGTITINNTTTVQPGSASNLVVSELMYHPSDPTSGEISAGFVDSDQFEWIELQNISTSVVDMTGVSFTGGFFYDFASGLMLQPGTRIVVARDRAAYLTRNPGASASLAAGAFLNASALNNGGETLLLVGSAGAVIKNFTYDDVAPWPTSADGFGYSLVLIAPQTNPDHNLASNWRLSSLTGGNPGSSDATPFTSDPNADADHDGLSARVEYALGTSDSVYSTSGVTASVGPDNFLTVTFVRSLAADAVIAEAQSSSDLSTWTSNFTVTESPRSDGTVLVTARSNTPATTRLFARVSVRPR